MGEYSCNITMKVMSIAVAEFPENPIHLLIKEYTLNHDSKDPII